MTCRLGEKTPIVTKLIQLKKIEESNAYNIWPINEIRSWFNRNFFGFYGCHLRSSKKREINFLESNYLEDIIKRWKNKPQIKVWKHKTYIDHPVYLPETDEIKVLPKSFFSNPMMYYQMVFHELGHSTMHPNRMNRDIYEETDDSFDEFKEAEEEILVTLFSLKVCFSDLNADKKKLNDIMWFNSLIFSKFANVIQNINQDYDFMKLERESDKIFKYMLKQLI